MHTKYIREALKRTFIPTLFTVSSLCGFGQLKPVYDFQQDDTLLRKTYYEQALAQQKKLISSLGKEYRDDYKTVYEDRFKSVAGLLKSRRVVTAAEAHDYLGTILKKITDANPELKEVTIRLLFSRDWWPNAYSMGEGTIVINAGLLVYLDNEAELVFVLCHELAHYYLDHSNKSIRKNIETINSEEFKKEIKRLSKEEYRVGEQLELLVRKLAFGHLRHSRENEAEADRQAFAFMKKTGYDCRGIISCLRLLDKIDDSLLYKPLDPGQLFNFKEYPFRKKWVEKESAIFGEMKENDSPLTKAEKDSLKTHPDCEKRIFLLQDSVAHIVTGKKFLVNEVLFNRLKKIFIVEMTEQQFRDNNLTRNMYYCLLMLQGGENIPFAVYSIARDLNLAYEKQKAHRLGTMTDKETRGYRADYNLLLRMVDRLRLEELADLNYYFCTRYKDQLSGYAGFEEEMKKAQKYKNEN